MLENIQRGDICIFQNGEEAVVTKFKPECCGEGTVRIYFNEEIIGGGTSNSAWNYYISGKWIGNGNNIAKVIHQ